MVNIRPARLWLMRGLYLWLAIVILFLQLLPLQTVPRSWAAPEMLIALTFAWSIRRPEYAPAILIGAVMLIADLLLQRPPGLLAALIVLSANTLNRRAAASRDMPFVIEWLIIAGTIIAVALAYSLLLALFFLPAPPLNLTVTQTGLTIAVYPLLVLITHFVLGVRRPAPGEVDALGHKL